MARFMMKYLVVVAAVVVIAVNAQPIEQELEQPGGLHPFSPAPLTGRSIFDQFTLGQEVEGARIIYTYQYQQSYDSVQSEISLDYDFPSPYDNPDSSDVITQVTLYVEAADDGNTQAYVTQGGIGESSISLQIVAENSNSLRYMIIIYGKEQ